MAGQPPAGRRRVHSPGLPGPRAITSYAQQRLGVIVAAYRAFLHLVQGRDDVSFALVVDLLRAETREGPGRQQRRLRRKDKTATPLSLRLPSRLAGAKQFKEGQELPPALCGHRSGRSFSPRAVTAGREADEVGRVRFSRCCCSQPHPLGKVKRISPGGRVVPPVPQLPVPQLRSATAVPVLPRRGTGRPPGSRSMRLGEAVCQS